MMMLMVRALMVLATASSFVMQPSSSGVIVRHAATLEPPPPSSRTKPPAPSSEAAELAACPLTQWGEPMGNIVEEQEKARREKPRPFTFELSPPKGLENSKDGQVEWLSKNADMVKEKMATSGAVIFRGWEVLKEPEGFRSAYEALGLSPCLDPLHAVSARPMVDKKSAVYEAVNGESRANFFIGMHNEFVGTRSPRAAMFVCFKQADVGGEFLVADGRAIFRDVETDLLKRLYEKRIRYSVMELPFFGFVDKIPVVKDAVAEVLRTVVSTAINAKVDFDVSMSWINSETLQARAPAQVPVLKHPVTGEATWFCNVHSHSALLRKRREATYGADQGTGVSQINKSDMLFGDDEPISQQDLDELDRVTNKHIKYLTMTPGDAVLLDNYSTMHGRNVFEGKRKHAVTWFE